METLQEVEFIVSPEHAALADQAQATIFVDGFCGAWSLVPASCPSEARLRRLAVGARVRMNLQTAHPASPIQ